MGRVVAEAGHARLEQAPHRGPDERADDHARTEDPSGASGADRQPGGHDAGEGQGEDDPQGYVEKLEAEALLVPIRSLCRAPRVSREPSDRRAGRQAQGGPSADREAGGMVGDTVEALGVEQSYEPAENPDDRGPHSCWAFWQLEAPHVAEQRPEALDRPPDGVANDRGDE